jgi:hypothetical protein
MKIGINETEAHKERRKERKMKEEKPCYEKGRT